MHATSLLGVKGSARRDWVVDKAPTDLQNTCRSNTYAFRTRRVTWIKTKREDVKSGRSGALKPDRLGLSCKANKCSDTGTGDLGVLTTHETLPCLGGADVVLLLSCWDSK